MILKTRPQNGSSGLGLRAELGPLLGVVADDRRPVERAGQIGRDRVEQPLHADVLEARPAEHRLRSAGQRGPPQRRVDHRLGELGTVEMGHVLLGERLVERREALSIVSRQASASSRRSSGISSTVNVEPRSSVLK